MKLPSGITIDFSNFTPEELRAAALEIEKAARNKGVLLPQPSDVGKITAVTTPHHTREAITTTKSVIISQAKQEQARLAIKTLSMHFARSESEFSVIDFVNRQGTTKLAVALTATEGIDIGDVHKTWDARRNWNEVLAREEEGRFTINLEGQAIDTLEQVDGHLLIAIAAANPMIHEWVWRTGEKDKSTPQGAPVAFLSMSQIALDLDFRTDDYKNTRIRPAIVL